MIEFIYSKDKQNKQSITVPNIQKLTMKEMRNTAKTYIETNGSSGSDKILEYFHQLGHISLSKQDVANALSQGDMFEFQRGENNSKKNGKWVLKEIEGELLK